MIYFYIYLFTLLVSSMSGLLYLKKVDISTKLAVALVCLTFVVEFSALQLYRKNIFPSLGGNTAPLYHIYTCIYIILISIYYSYQLNLKNKNVNIFLVIFWIIFCSTNVYFQPLLSQSTHTILLQRIIITFLSPYLIYKIFLNENIIHVLKYSHFCLLIGLLIIGVGGLFHWAFFDDLVKHHSKYRSLLINSQTIINTIGYGLIGISFQLNNKRLAK